MKRVRGKGMGWGGGRWGKNVQVRVFVVRGVKKDNQEMGPETNTQSALRTPEERTSHGLHGCRV